MQNLAVDKYWFYFYCGPADAEVFAVYSGRNVHFTQRIDGLFITVPYWALGLLFVLLPLAYFPALLLRRLRRLQDNRLCRKCGYDLCGNAASRRLLRRRRRRGTRLSHCDVGLRSQKAH